MPITNAPNNTDKTARAANSFASLGKSASPVNPPNAGAGGDHRMGSYPLSGQASPVQPPNHRFDWDMADAKMPQPASAIEPGKGAVPVNPGIGGVTRAMPIPDMASKRAK
jgi:hypothetical protein